MNPSLHDKTGTTAGSQAAFPRETRHPLRTGLRALDSGNALDDAALDAQGRTGGCAGLGRDGVDAEVGDLFGCGEAAQQARGAVLGDEQGLHFRRGYPALACRFLHHGDGALGAGGPRQDAVHRHAGAGQHLGQAA